MGLMEPNAGQTPDSPSLAGVHPVIREYIVSTPDTCGGKPRIAGSRIRVKDIVIWHVHQGMTPTEIVSKWPHLTLASVRTDNASFSPDGVSSATASPP